MLAFDNSLSSNQPYNSCQLCLCKGTIFHAAKAAFNFSPRPVECIKRNCMLLGV